ncbi:hypothetical protein [Cupriavidus pampae]|uniref:Rubrerythrin-like domain-containing protein n=1 Tax=Cupriavidus pampae TaxID=659251 RepID=A0ABN7ZCW4_9BURK|nr:hypothetical protein [Cupriavidus pampae]CAG9183823.1 hypothetical protein LMG32289_05432 [Cupriavidus pampae]
MMQRATRVVECEACSWQGEHHHTDSGHCPECDGQCLDLAVIYGEVPEPGAPQQDPT